MSVFFILQSQSPCDWKSPITLFTACEADQSIVGDGTCDAEAATWECDEYDGGDCIGMYLDWFICEKVDFMEFWKIVENAEKTELVHYFVKSTYRCFYWCTLQTFENFFIVL